MEEVACGSREDSIAITCRPWRRTYSSDTGNGTMTGKPTCSQDCTDAMAAFHGELGREDGLRCG